MDCAFVRDEAIVDLVNFIGLEVEQETLVRRFPAESFWNRFVIRVQHGQLERAVPQTDVPVGR